jgi:hypothetical protein
LPAVILDELNGFLTAEEVRNCKEIYERYQRKRLLEEQEKEICARFESKLKEHF